MNVEELEELTNRVRSQMEHALYGLEEEIEEVMIGFFLRSHILLEGVPGIGKTLLARCLSLAVDSRFRRIQFTPDLMPSDITGTFVFRQDEEQFTFRKGPLFTDILLADEINRTPPKTQAALLEAMEEGATTVDGERFDHSDLFFVIATQNPIEYEGTYPLPEAQLDRFLMKVQISYPNRDSEEKILRRHKPHPDEGELKEMGIDPVVSPDQVRAARKTIYEIEIEEDLYGYILDLMEESRRNPSVSLGASPRAGLHLLTASRAKAAFSGRNFVIPDDIKRMAVPVLRHRIKPNAEAELAGETGETVVRNLLDSVDVPR